MKKKTDASGRLCFGVLSTWFRGQYQLELVSGMEYEAKKNNVSIYYFSGRCIQSPVQYENSFNIIFDLVPLKSLDGLIIPALLANYCTDEGIIDFVSKYQGIPLITIGFRIKGIKAILLNNESGFRELLEHLVKTHGYKKFAFIHGPAGNPDARERYGMFRKILASYGIEADENKVVYGDFSYLAGKNGVKELFAGRGFRPGRDIDAVVASNDLMALGAMDQLKESGIDLPGSLAITGFDNTFDAQNSTPRLTTISQNAFGIGRMAIKKIIGFGQTEELVYFDTKLVTRNSCGCTADDESPITGEIRQLTVKNRQMMMPMASSTDRDKNEKRDVAFQYQTISEFYFYQLIYVSDALKQVQSLDELETWIHGGFKSLGIGECYLFFYIDKTISPAGFTLAAGYNSRGIIPEEKKTTYNFASIISNLLENEERKSYCIVPLLFRDEQFGIMIMAVNMKAWIAYETIRSQVSSSLKSIFLIDNIRKMNNKLTQTNAKLKLSEEQKTRFFINLAHETKTPLTLIRNYLLKYMQAHEQNDDLLIIRQNIDFLLENMAVFLDVEKLEKGKILYNHNHVIDLSLMMRNKVVIFSEVADKKHISILPDIAPGITVRADPWAMDRILNNLLDNAVKYTQEKGRIFVGLEIKDNSVSLYVKDTGRGIAKDKIRHIFKPYYQLVNAQKSSQGIGMGLYIVKKILDEINASIEVTSSEGEGSCFIIRMQPFAGKPDESIFRDSPSDRMLPGLRFTKELTEETISPEKHSILVVDDNISMLTFLRESFKDTYNIYMAADVKSAFIKLKTMPAPEVIVSDIMMDEIDGHEFLSMLKEHEEYADIAFIFLTAKQTKKEKIRGLSGGAIDFIEKPFAIEELAGKIDSIITMREKQRKKDVSAIRKKLQTVLSEIERPAADSGSTDITQFCITHKISGREKEIIILKCKGLINKEIAAQLNISLRTVEYHITNIYKKLNIGDNFALLQLFNNMK